MQVSTSCKCVHVHNLYNIIYIYACIDACCMIYDTIYNRIAHHSIVLIYMLISEYTLTYLLLYTYYLELF